MSEKNNRKDNKTALVRVACSKILRILRVHYRAGVPFALHGAPAIAKSDKMKQGCITLAEDYGREFFEWNRSSEVEKLAVFNSGAKNVFFLADIRSSETNFDSLSLPKMNTGKDYMTQDYALLFKVASLPDARGVLFFDEFNLAPNMIKSQFFKIINDKAIGDLPIADGVLPVMAGNEAEHSRAVTSDAVPLVLRRGNYFIEPPTAEEWCDYAAKTEHHSWIIGYIGFQPNHLHNIEYDLPDSVGQSCPRTWSRLSQIMIAEKKATGKEMPLDDLFMFATGLVGQAVGREFVAFAKLAQEVNLNEILANPKSIQRYDTDDNNGLMYAIISGIVEKWRTDKKVLSPALEIACELRRVEFGAFLLRALRHTDVVAWRKALGDEKLVKRDIIAASIKRYGKFFGDE